MRARYGKTSVVEWVDKQLVSYTVELTRRCSPRAEVVLEQVVPYVERNLRML